MKPLFSKGDLASVTPAAWRGQWPGVHYGIVLASWDTESKWESRAASMRYWMLIEGKVLSFSEGELSAVAAPG